MTKGLKQQALNDEVLLREDRGPVALLTLNRPEARNSLSLDMIAALHREVEDLGDSDAIRAIVITGAGSACSDMMMSIVRCSKPVISGVNGIAMAAGCQLVASCDLAVASIGARFATP